MALVFGAVAMLCANLSAITPGNLLTGLHSPRLDGGNLNHLRMQVAELQNEAARIRNENSKLMTMLTLAEEDQGAVTRRVGALESSLPTIIESTARPSVQPQIDTSVVTSSIGENPNGQEVVSGGDGVVILQAVGGTVAIKTRPLEQAPPAPKTVYLPEVDNSVVQPQPRPAPEVQQQAMPTPPPTRVIVAPPSAFGIALGPQVTVQDAFIAWKDITKKVGPLLLGLGPLLSGNAGVDQQRLVAGPIADYAQAEQLCVRMIRVGISCLPVPYAGQALPD